ncbi:mediator of RNA polymerase II transcription subunit 15-like [Aphis craccivora]|uniref:Mediator of RNA polymerase II transcription subunit 15-like n=1 Tax=Aphis craccivora TaxID=307492 RepID=A0A6G0YHV8_APHCR|nr:mediator of RNA polymerase II transcription subunit 15-like [Aphis craccivora]
MIDDQISTVNHISETQAKQTACENFLSTMLAKQLSGRSAENASTSKSEGSHQENVPWLHFASLAMHYLGMLNLNPIKGIIVYEKRR